MKIVEGILLILVINFIVAVSYFLYMTLVKNNRRQGVVTGLLILSCPVVAFAFLGLSWIFHKIFELFGEKEIDPAELSLSKNKVQLKVGADILQNANYVPLEEVLLLASKKNKRDGFLSVLKENVEESVSLIKHAVNDEDSEISHYAASSLMDIVSRFKEKEKELYTLSQMEPTSVHKATYLSYVIPFLLEEILSVTEKQKLMEKIDFSMKEYTKADFIAIKGELLGKIALLWGRVGDSNRADCWLKEAFITDPKSLEVYKAGLQYYYATEQMGEFKSLMENLKSSNIVIDNEVLELIRFFN